jgi:hypothetical protein
MMPRETMKTGNAPMIRHIGRKSNSIVIPRECHAGIVLLRELFGWSYFDIEKAFGVRPNTARLICRKWEDA